jgi:ligand-binding SRPBCC domain-containing protein
MSAITPPMIPVQMEQAPDTLNAGGQMSFVLWLGPIPVCWRASVSRACEYGFTDHQLEGPFRYWIHRHRFEPVDETATDVIDEVEAGLRWHALWAPIGLAMWLGLPVLFAFRGWKTRQLLETERTR